MFKMLNFRLANMAKVNVPVSDHLEYAFTITPGQAMPPKKSAKNRNKTEKKM